MRDLTRVIHRIENGETEYIVSSGWGEPEDFRLEIINEHNWFDVFLTIEELELLKELILNTLIKSQNSKQESGSCGVCDDREVGNFFPPGVLGDKTDGDK